MTRINEWRFKERSLSAGLTTVLRSPNGITVLFCTTKMEGWPRQWHWTVESAAGGIHAGSYESEEREPHKVVLDLLGDVRTSLNRLETQNTGNQSIQAITAGFAKHALGGIQQIEDKLLE